MSPILRTGDVGYINKHGFLFITDQVKGLIQYKGFQVAPAGLEAYLHDFSGMANCAVVRVWHKAMVTEVPRAYGVLHDASKPFIEGLMA
jgi:acyl-CoA synthetase (AMP-forming)/AMP-acid ligase II